MREASSPTDLITTAGKNHVVGTSRPDLSLMGAEANIFFDVLGPPGISNAAQILEQRCCQQGM